MSPAADSNRGLKRGNYQLLTRLSASAMAEIHLARDVTPGGAGRLVAMKQLLPLLGDEARLITAFLDEARITARLSHPSVAQVLDFGCEPGTGEVYFVMEMVWGPTLEQVFRAVRASGRALPIPLACRLVHDLCLGLHAAHTYVDAETKRPLEVTHRDVSPKNVMVTWSGTVKIIDFGIATATNRLTRTRFGVVKGTSGYMAPEQLDELPVTASADVYAAAVVLWELLVSERLFGGGIPGVMKALHGEVPAPIEKNPQVPRNLSELVMRALARRPSERISSAQTFAFELAQCVALSEREDVAAVLAQLLPNKRKCSMALLAEATKPLPNVRLLGELARACRADADADAPATGGAPGVGAVKVSPGQAVKSPSAVGDQEATTQGGSDWDPAAPTVLTSHQGLEGRLSPFARLAPGFRPRHAVVLGAVIAALGVAAWWVLSF